MRRRALAIVVALGLVGGLLLWKLRGSETESGDPSVPTSTRSTTARADAARTPSKPEARVLPADPAADPVAQPQPVPLDPSAKPPSLDAPVSKPAPPQKPFTREETITKREADLQLLDATRARLEADLAAAQGAGSATVASELRFRLARLATLRKQRTAELEQIRAGGALPP